MLTEIYKAHLHPEESEAGARELLLVRDAGGGPGPGDREPERDLSSLSRKQPKESLPGGH